MKEDKKKAKWIIAHEETCMKVKCSNCDCLINFFWNDWINANYCPHCGANMRREEV